MERDKHGNIIVMMPAGGTTGIFNAMLSGCRLGWLIDRLEKTVRIYHNDGNVELVSGGSITLSGEDILPDFVMKMAL